MSWIGLRDNVGGVFSPIGLGRADRAPYDLDAVMPRGTLMMEFSSDPRGGAQTLLDYGSSHPWAAGLTLTLGGNGTLRLTQWQGDQRRVHKLATDVLTVKPSVTVTYTWDAPLRRGVLALEVGDSVPVFAELIAPLPLSMRDGVRMIADARHCAVNSGATFVAIADEVMPIGVLPTLGGDTMIDTPKGAVAVSNLRAGQMVITALGDTAQVRWCGSALLPARGRFAPLTLRAPFHGLRQDMTVAPNQRLQAAGSEVEYLFGTDTVAMRAGHMVDGQSVRPAACGLTYRYWQVLLDRAAPMRVAGLVFEGLDVTGVRLDASLRQHSVLAPFPAELVPMQKGIEVPLLQSYETLTLRKLLVA
ncbi:MAG: hypothetical protein ACJAXK_001459 [Yoonia sp.]|jgi:hypothetical protein